MVANSLDFMVRISYYTALIPGNNFRRTSMKKLIVTTLFCVSNLFAANLTIDNQTASIVDSQSYQFAYVGLNSTGTLNIASSGSLNAMLAVGFNAGSNGTVYNYGTCNGNLFSVAARGTGTFNNYGTMSYNKAGLCGGYANTSGGNGTLNFYSGTYTGTYLTISTTGHQGTLNIYGGTMIFFNGYNGGINLGTGTANLLIAGGNVTMEEFQYLSSGDYSFNFTGGTLTVTRAFSSDIHFAMAEGALLRLTPAAYNSNIANQIITSGQVQTEYANGYYNITVIPEPATMLLMGLGLFACKLAGRFPVFEFLMT
jgi:hypothetical protein